MNTKLDFEKDIGIDPDALDIEWLRQPVNYMNYATEAANADKKVKHAKEILEVVDAQIDREIRESAEKKPTEAQIDSQKTLDERHQKALEAYNDALYEYNICISAVKAMDHKKSSLENLVKLWQGSYFSGPKEARNLSMEYESKGFDEYAQSSAQSRQRKKLNDKN